MEFSATYAICCFAIVGYILIKYGKKLTASLGDYAFAYFMTKFSYVFCRIVADDKRRLFAPLSELSKTLSRPPKIVEIGPGSGTNFQFYPAGSEVLCIDPNPSFEQYLEQSAKKYPHIRCIWVNGFAEDLRGIAENSIDAVVGTLVLCSVRDVDSCLKEIKRVLRNVSLLLL
jgi:ubiquinone/menaquinone biosynthesis C-methylase UbiE